MSDSNWTPKEPRRPFQPKPDAFKVEKIIPKEFIEATEDEARADNLIKDIENGHPDKH